MNDLVSRLSAGDHRVEICLRPERSAAAFQACLTRGYVHVKFTDTHGGTELGVRLDSASSELSAADFSRRTGSVRLVGRLTLDYIPVRCIAEIDIEKLAGIGHLECIADSSQSAPSSTTEEVNDA